MFFILFCSSKMSDVNDGNVNVFFTDLEYLDEQYLEEGQHYEDQDALYSVNFTVSVRQFKGQNKAGKQIGVVKIIGNSMELFKQNIYDKLKVHFKH